MDARRGALTTMLDWLALQGCGSPSLSLGIEVRVDDAGGAGLFATSALPSGSRPVSVPLLCILRANAPSPDPQFTEAIRQLSSSSRAPPPLATLVLRLAYEASLGASSPFAPYIAALPSRLPSLLHCSDTAAARAHAAWPWPDCDGTWLIRRQRLRAAIARVTGIVSQRWCSADTLLWAHAMVVSRAMLVPRLDGAGKGSPATGPGDAYLLEPALVPLADLANHRPGALASFTSVACQAKTASTSSGAAAWGRCSAGPAAASSTALDHAHMWDFLDDDAVTRVIHSDTAALDSSTGAIPSSHVVFAGSKRPASSLLGRSEQRCLPCCLVLQLHSPVGAGCEVSINYGVLGTAALLEWFGCALSDNPGEIVRVEAQPHPRASRSCPGLGLVLNGGGDAVDMSHGVSPVSLDALPHDTATAAAHDASSFDLLPGMPSLDGLLLALRCVDPSRVCACADTARCVSSTDPDAGRAAVAGADYEVLAFVEQHADAGRAACRWLRAQLLGLLARPCLRSCSLETQLVTRAAAAPTTSSCVDELEAMTIIEGLDTWRACVRRRVLEHSVFLEGV